MDNHHYFEEIEIPNMPSCLIFLDIDGTLIPDAPEECFLENIVIGKVTQLSKHHTVYLCTNGKDRNRAQSIASRLGITLVESKHKKYSRKILNDLPLDQNRQTLVIGDKILTDGLLAKRLQAHLYLVKRKYSGKERLLVRLSNYLDDVVTVTIFP